MTMRSALGPLLWPAVIAAGCFDPHSLRHDDASTGGDDDDGGESAGDDRESGSSSSASSDGDDAHTVTEESSEVDEGEASDGESSSDDGSVEEPTGELSFFVTSTGTGAMGGNLGGLAGADLRCQELADAVGAGDRTWQAYLSTAPIDGFDGELVHARDRIGTGPWFNANGVLVAYDLDDLHDGPIAEDRLLTELGMEPPSEEHDILTGTGSDGFALESFPENPDAPAPTCGNWTRNDANGWTWVGHFDAAGPDTWNSAHGISCDPAGLASTAGAGRTYCFAL